MRHSDLMVAPARQVLTRLGLEELRTPAEVDAFMAKGRDGVALLAVNSMCGCSAGSMRPAVALALERGPKPRHAATVFAGQDLAATARAREYLAGHPPSSPAIALFRDGALVFLLQRADIQGRPPHAIADALADALAAHASGEATR
jgi:putative YphP/YqiW family bacilliredoxin